MVRFFARLSIGIVIVFWLVSGVMCLIGGLIAPPALQTLQQFDCTPKPCWHGIQLGVTTVQEATAILSADKTIRFVDFHPTDNEVCWVWENQWHIYRIDGCYSNASPFLSLRYTNNPIRLGDFIFLLGRPIASGICDNRGSVYWTNAQIDVQVPANVTQIDPDLIIREISYSPAQFNPASFSTRLQWTGFSHWEIANYACGG